MIDALITTRILVQFIGQVFAVMLLRAKRPDMPRPFRMWLYPVPALVALAGWIFLLLTSGWLARRVRPRHARPRHRVFPPLVVARAPLAIWRQGSGASERVTRYRRILAGAPRVRLLLRPVAVPGRNRMSDIRVRSLWMLPPLTRLAAALAIGAFATSHVASAPSQRTSTVKALVGGTLIDGFGGAPIRNSVVLIEGERINAVGQVGPLAVPAGAEVISTEGMTVLPGLWDMHVHLMINGHSDYAHWDKTYPPLIESVIMPASAKQLLMAGVTSARDLGGPLEAEHRGSRSDQERQDSRPHTLRVRPVHSARTVSGHRSMFAGE